MREQGFKVTVALAVVVGMSMSYFSLLSGATYSAVAIRTSVAVAVIGLLIWLFTFTTSQSSGTMQIASSNLADIMGFESEGDQTVAGTEMDGFPLVEEDDEEDDLNFEPLDSGLPKA